MALLNEEILKNVTEMLANLNSDVKLIVFTKQENCEYCPQIIQLLNEVAVTSDKVSVEVHEYNQDDQAVKDYKIDKAPSIAIVGEKDYGIRFNGIPSGYEFSTLLHGIQKASNGESELDEHTKTFLSTLNDPVLLQVFVTPTCPYCPRAATLAYDMAAQSDLVHAEVIESMEFQELANQFNVMGVPLSVINGKERVEGAAPVPQIVKAIQKTLA